MFLRTLLVFLAATAWLRATPAFDAAMALANAKRYPEARAALEKVVTAEPKNARAWYELGMVWQKRRDDEAYAEAVKCLAKAIELDPNNADYLADYGGTSMELADRTRSISAATRGREAMEKAIALDPANLEGREGLYRFYKQAPFFVGGSSSKAAAQLEEIRKRDPGRANTIEIAEKANDKDYAGAFALCDQLLARNPANYVALYHYGRTACLSGLRLVRGLECLQKALQIDPPGPNAPGHTYVWWRIGTLQEKLGRIADARAAYETAIKLDPGDRQAAEALEKLQSAHTRG